MQNALASATSTQPQISPLGLAPSFGDITQKVAALDQEELEFVIQRLIIREGIEEETARKLRIEFLRFVSFNFITRKSTAPSKLVDVFWHAFILYTAQYSVFCQKHLGFFLHHRPEDHSREKVLHDGTLLLTKRLIRDLYPQHDQKIWSDQAICSQSNCNADPPDYPGGIQK